MERFNHSPLRSLNASGYSYDRIIGTGGIGSGMFFSFTNNETLGRNESRLGNLLPCKDYCKQHIIMHYVAVLLGAGKNNGMHVDPIGKIGNDDIGRSLVSYMQSVGMNTSAVGISEGINTLFSVCLQYPDTSGGNITTGNSASSRVGDEDIDLFFQNNSVVHDRNIILSVPEVPLSPRIKLLEYGRKYNALNISCILSAEVEEFRNRGGFEMTDILSVNIDEAKSIAKVTGGETQDIVDACISELVKFNPGITALVTAGSKGAYCYSDKNLSFYPALNVRAISTAGAGDAFLAGTICGVCCGLPVCDDGKKTDSLHTATQLGILLSALSVTSPDTIHPITGAEELAAFAKSINISFGEEFMQLFKK